MHIDFHSSQPPAGDIVNLRDVSLPDVPPYDAGLENITLRVQAGDLVLIQLAHGLHHHPLADLISGLIEPEEGEVEVFGQRWPDWRADQQARARWRIGRVFERQGWLSNLDVDENVTLAERHHTHRPLDDIHAEARRLGALAGLDEIPVTRPPVTDREALRRAEWVRASLGSPWLLLLERPGHGLADGWIDQLQLLVKEARQRGAAVIWLGESPEEWQDSTLSPSLKLRAEGNTLRPV